MGHEADGFFLGLPGSHDIAAVRVCHYPQFYAALRASSDQVISVHARPQEAEPCNGNPPNLDPLAGISPRKTMSAKAAIEANATGFS